MAVRPARAAEVRYDACAVRALAPRAELGDRQRFGSDEEALAFVDQAARDALNQAPARAGP